MEETDEDYFVPNLHHTSDLYDLQSNLEDRELRDMDLEYGITSDLYGRKNFKKMLALIHAKICHNESVSI